MSNFKKVGGLWSKEDKNGQKYLSGKIGERTIFVFKNKEKTGNQPDYTIHTPDDRGE